MVKCWKRHRDVPTKISELVDRAVDDLQRRQLDLKERMSKKNIKVEHLDKVIDLLDCCYLVGETMPEDGDAENLRLKQKLKDIQGAQAKEDSNLEKIQARFLLLRKKGKLGVATTKHFHPASSETTKSAIVVAHNFPGPVHDTFNIVQQECIDIQEGAQVSPLPCAEIQEGNDEWVECGLCTKWRRLPPGISADTLSLTQWACIDGDVWKKGLNCDVLEDVWHDVSYLPT
jgi:hypothetical protein